MGERVGRGEGIRSEKEAGAGPTPIGQAVLSSGESAGVLRGQRNLVHIGAKAWARGDGRIPQGAPRPSGFSQEGLSQNTHGLSPIPAHTGRQVT